ncbi:uncharacterized protein LOC106457465 [Limulus polyphemus]|uniref:Uncharacterized protein LOC106457465 n=1 Tax=Limulus polyphemus TaxID=6850 RepID=A0ABM1B0N3_LIMPO|nr:uncharacterized protein LOC106457465 [Limulus polyphemus]
MAAKWVLFYCLGLLYVNTVWAIQCYRCESNIDMHCAEEFTKYYSLLEPESCDDIFEATFCIKTTGMYEGEIGTKRFCSSRDHGNYCEYIRRPGDDREYRSCVYTCTGDGCNSAPSWMTWSFKQMLLLLFTIFSHLLLP